MIFLEEEGIMKAKYGKKSQESVEKAMNEMKRGELKSGSSGKTVKNPKQAIAIGLSEARRSGAKVPSKKGAQMDYLLLVVTKDVMDIM